MFLHNTNCEVAQVFDLLMDPKHQEIGTTLSTKRRKNNIRQYLSLGNVLDNVLDRSFPKGKLFWD